MFLAAFAAAFATATPALAANPAPCNGKTLYADDAGDQFFEPTGLASLNSNFKKLGHKAADNADITSVYFSYDAVRKASYVNLQLTDASLTLPSPADAPTGMSYYVMYYWNGQPLYVKAANEDGTRLTYSYGTIDTEQGTYSNVGSTRGALFTGQGGVVQIQIPAVNGGVVGQTLNAVVGATFYDQGLFINSVDVAPDGSDTVDPNGDDYAITTCA